MATLPLQSTRFAYNDTGNGPEYDEITFSAGFAGVEGDLIVRTNNAAVVCGADPAIISYLEQTVYTNVIPGLVDPTQSSRAIMAMMKVRGEDLFEMSAWHGTPASAVLPDADMDGQPRYGVSFETVSGVSAWVIDLTEAAATRVTILKRLSSATDLYPRCLVKFLPANLTFA